MRSSVSSKMNIPKTINVGYVKREDTYTKKLAYVIYTDAKNVLRKEDSWNGWRDHTIEPQKFDNVPTSGFVLNKKVGGYRYSWNSRATYVRVYDPRDFEFEISVSNLLFILQETSSIQGKGLEGEFVYAWDGKDLILLPANCQEYVESQNFTDKQTNKVGKSEIVEGATYLMKDMRTVMYLGKHPWCEEIGYSVDKRYKPVGNRHIFIDVNYKKPEYILHTDSPYIALTGYTKLADKVSDPLDTFADEYIRYKESVFCKKELGLEVVLTKPDYRKQTVEKYGYYNPHYMLIKENDGYYTPVEARLYRNEKDRTFMYKVGDKCKLDLTDSSKAIPNFITEASYKASRSYSYYGNRANEREVPPEFLEGKEFYTIIMKTDREDYDLLHRGFKSTY